MQLTSCTIDGEEQIRYTTYGICVKQADGQTIMEHKDISTNRKFVEDFIQLHRDYDVAYIHIEDLLEDYLD